MSNIQILIILSLILAMTNQVMAQVISGRILDIETRDPIPYTNVFFDNSFNGTVSDIDGYFRLDISQNIGQNIVISRVGYQTQLVEDYSSEQFLAIYLIQQTLMLEELVVTANTTVHEKMIAKFLRGFLGETRNARGCSISNIDDIRLEYQDSTGTLVANSEGPIIIHNKRLGYRIKYFLEEYWENEQRIFYRGYSIFEVDTTLSPRKLRHIRKTRKKAYLGSRMHFFRTLWHEDLKGSKFSVFYDNSNNKIKLKEHVFEESKQVKIFSASSRLRIIYSDRSPSYISFHKSDGVRFLESGYFAPENLRWQGQMPRLRVGDLLPYEYDPGLN